VKGEDIGFARFSGDGSKPFLYVTVRKRGMGFVSAFDTSTWKEVKSRKLQTTLSLLFRLLETEGECPVLSHVVVF